MKVNEFEPKESSQSFKKNHDIAVAAHTSLLRSFSASDILCSRSDRVLTQPTGS